MEELFSIHRLHMALRNTLCTLPTALRIQMEKAYNASGTAKDNMPPKGSCNTGTLGNTCLTEPFVSPESTCTLT